MLFSAQASFAQQRILLDEQVRFTDAVGVYNELIVFRVIVGSLSINRLQRAVASVLMKHKVLRTSISYDSNDGTYIQRVIGDYYRFTRPRIQIIENFDQLDHILIHLTNQIDLFELSDGRALHWQILHQLVSTETPNIDTLNPSDVLIFAFHHAAYDRASQQIFLHDLALAYNNDCSLPIHDDELQYIDYAEHERQMDMTSSRNFWRSQLHEYDLQHRLCLPFDRQRLSNDQRSGLAIVVDLAFDEQLTRSFITYASKHQLTLFQLGLAAFLAFLFKLTNGQTDLCIASINANRYRAELRHLIGMFVATLPYRIQINPHHSFDQLVEHVRQQCLSILEHSHYPLQHILADIHQQQPSQTTTTPAFLETVFDFVTLSSDINHWTLDGTQLEAIALQSNANVAKFDFMLTMIYNPSTMNNNQLSCSFTCSNDLFDQSTVQTIASRFSALLHQLFNPIETSMTTNPLYKCSILQPHEIKMMNELNQIDGDDDDDAADDANKQSKLENITISTLFSQQADLNEQKIAVELDEQCLTYSELLFYVQRLSLYLIDECHVNIGDIICQCLERSLSMVSEPRNRIGCFVYLEEDVAGDWYDVN